MIKSHQGSVSLLKSFDEAWSFLKREGRVDLETGREKTPFQANANVTSRGKHAGERVIVFFQNGLEFGRSYSCCWGHYYNCNRTRIGMYCKALDSFIS